MTELMKPAAESFLTLDQAKEVGRDICGSILMPKESAEVFEIERNRAAVRFGMRFLRKDMRGLSIWQLAKICDFFGDHVTGIGSESDGRIVIMFK